MKTRIYIVLFVLFIFNISFSQIKNESKLQVNPYFGISSPQGNFKDFSGSGSVFGVSIDKYLSNTFALGFDINFQSNKYENSFDFSTITAPNIITTNNQGNWNATNFTFGPTYKIGSKAFFTELYAKAGISYVKSPQADAIFQDSANEKTIFDLPEQKRTSFGLTTGIRFNYKISPKTSLFLNTQLVTSSAEVQYCNCGLDEALSFNETSDPQTIIEQEPIVETIKPSYLNINAGLSFNLGGTKKSPINEEENNNINPPLCEVIYDDFTCFGSSTTLNFTSTWMSHNSSSKLHVEVYENNVLVASGSQVTNNGLPLGSSNSSRQHSITTNGLNPGLPMSVRISIIDTNGNVVCGSMYDDFFAPSCDNPTVSCEFEIDPTNFTCDSNGITFIGVSTWSNQLIGSTIDIVATQGSTSVPLTFSQNIIPYTTTTVSGSVTHDISIPLSYSNTPITLAMRITDPTTGASKSCGGLDFVVPECESVPICEFTAEAQSCLINGKSIINFTANWFNYVNPANYDATIYLRDASNGNTFPFINISNNNMPLGIGIGTGTRTFSVDFSGHEGKTIEARLTICPHGTTKDCCDKIIKIEVPKCCIDCYDIEEERTTKINQIGNNFNVTGYLSSGDAIKKIMVQLEYFRADDLSGVPIVTPVNFEFLSTSTINGNPVNLIGSLTGFRSNLIIQDFPPNTNSANFDLKIDNYYNKRMLQYRVKITVFNDKGEYCERYFKH